MLYKRILKSDVENIKDLRKKADKDFSQLKQSIQGIVSELNVARGSCLEVNAYSDLILVAAEILKSYDPEEYLGVNGIKNKVNKVINNIAGEAE